jgi:hypothetical protein
MLSIQMVVAILANLREAKLGMKLWKQGVGTSFAMMAAFVAFVSRRRASLRISASLVASTSSAVQREDRAGPLFARGSWHGRRRVGLDAQRGSMAHWSISG